MFAEIVAEHRDRPIGPILVDSCIELGIAPALMDPATWDELCLTITLYGGVPARLLARAMDSGLPDATVARKTPDLIRGHSATGTPSPNDSPPIPGAGIVYPPWPAPSWQYPAPACTGPP